MLYYFIVLFTLLYHRHCSVFVILFFHTDYNTLNSNINVCLTLVGPQTQIWGYLAVYCNFNLQITWGGVPFQFYDIIVIYSSNLKKKKKKK